MSSLLSRWRSTPRLAVIGTDLKFIAPLIPRFSEAFEVRVDEWSRFRSHDEAQTERILKWADVVVCEWAGPNAVLASQRKKKGQWLVVRLHRMELQHPDWRQIDIDAVDRVVTVGPYYRRRVLGETGWPAEKVVFVPNFVDGDRFTADKAEDAHFNLGMIGIASARKRLDIGLDVLSLLREDEPRFRLFLKGESPWERKWVADRSDEVAFFESVRRRIDSDPTLHQAVTFDPHGLDVGSWLHKIGFVLSCSDDESFHLSPAEGMASGAVPIILPWPGADEIYDPEWIAADAAGMAARASELASNPHLLVETGKRARAEVLAKYGIDEVTDIWMRDVLSA